jgi:hypothetical protein
MRKMISLVLIGCVVVASCGIYAMMLSDDKELKADEYDESNFPIDSSVKTTLIEDDLDKELKYFKWLRDEKK